jgi:acetyl esterase/lipase
MLATMKDGTWLDKVVQDGNLTRIDAASGFSASFPPTMFVHGTGDTAVDCKTSLRAFEDLKRLGVEVDILLPEGQQHMFDVTLGFEDEMFKEYVLKGFNFLKKHV